MRLTAAPILLVMSMITYLQPSPLCVVPGEFGFLSSMWMMYGIMGAIHAGPWWSLVRSLRNRSTNPRA
jgi:hypothetical protein